MPRISDLIFDIQIEVFSGVLLLFTSILWMTKCKTKKSLLKMKKNVFWLILGISISALYFSIRASIGSYDIRLLQNLFIIIQLFHVVIIIDLMKYSKFTKDDMMKTLLNLALLQGFIAILMLAFPTFKEVALSLYYLNREENIFISRMRIYGISGDYTFFTPIYHGILASVAFFYSIFKSKRYFAYLPFILIIILLNGRFGLLIFMLSPMVVLAHFVYKAKISLKMIQISFLTVLIIITGVFSLKIISPYTYNWILSGVKDTLNLLLYSEVSGNYKALAGYHLSFPQGSGIIFGEGFRLFGGKGLERGYHSSDIGYVNDMFMGGLIYISVLYGSIIQFFHKRPKTANLYNKVDYELQSIISKYLILALLLANYKGEVMRGGLVLLGSIFIKLIISEKEQ